MHTRPPKLDPRTKLALALMAAAVVVCSLSLNAAMMVYMVFIAAMGGIATYRGYGRWLLLVLPMAFFFGLITAFTFDLEAGLTSGLKLLSLTTVGYLFFVSTPPEDLSNALIKAGLPYRVAFVVSAGMQFVPVLGRKAREVRDAQQARGIPMAMGWKIIRHAPAFLIPLLIQAFQLAEELAEAMESRGFGRPQRSYYLSFKLKPLDYFVMMSGAAATLGLCWFLRT